MVKRSNVLVYLMTSVLLLKVEGSIFCEKDRAKWDKNARNLDFREFDRNRSPRRVTLYDVTTVYAWTNLVKIAFQSSYVYEPDTRLWRAGTS